MAAVTFAPQVLVREFAAAASDSRVQFLSPLNFAVVREYADNLKAASYTPPEGAGFHVPAAAAAAASASADDAALPMHALREGGRVFAPAALHLLPTSPQGGAAAAQQHLPQQFFQQPQPYLQQQQVQLQQPKLIDDWHLKPNGRIYQQNGEHSSEISNMHRRQVLTRSGSFYTLGRLDPPVARVLAVVAPHWDAEDPLCPRTRQELLYAERVAFGAAAPLAQVLAGLRAAEAAMGHAEFLAPKWQVIRQILYTMGVYE